MTKRFKESTKQFKNKEDINSKFKLFLEGYKSTASGEASIDLEDFVITTEKQTLRESNKAGVSFDDCVEE